LRFSYTVKYVIPWKFNSDCYHFYKPATRSYKHGHIVYERTSFLRVFSTSQFYKMTTLLNRF